MADDKKDIKTRITSENATASGLASAKQAITAWAGDIRTKIVEALSIEKLLEKATEALKDFFTESVEKGSEAEQAWAQLGNTLGNVGVNVAAARPEIDEAITALQRVSNVRSDDAIAGFQKLVMLSGDYEGSLKNLTLVADVATAKHVSFSEAAELVGRVMAGTATRGLREFGIATQDPIQAIEQLRQKISGTSETELGTFAGAIDHTKMAFGTLEEEVGRVITQNPELRKQVLSAANAFLDAAEWIEKNKATFAVWVAGIIAGTKAAAISIFDSLRIVKDLAEALGAMVASVLTASVASILEQFNKIPHAINDMIEAANHLPGVHIDVRMPTLDRAVNFFNERLATAKAEARAAGTDGQAALDQMDRAWKNVTETVQKAGTAVESADGKLRRAAHDGAATGAPAEVEAFDIAREKERQDRLNRVGTLQENAHTIGGKSVDTSKLVVKAAKLPDDAQAEIFSGFEKDVIEPLAEHVQSALADTLGSAIGDGLMAAFDHKRIKDGFDAGGKAILGGMGKMLEQQGAVYLAYGAKMLPLTAHLFNPATSAAAALAIGALLEAMGASLEALGGSGGGGGFSGGGGGSSVSSAAAAQASLGDTSEQPTTIVFKGSKYVLDTSNPDDLQNFADMWKLAHGTKNLTIVVEG